MEPEHVSSEQPGGLQGGRELGESNKVSSRGKPVDNDSVT